MLHLAHHLLVEGLQVVVDNLGHIYRDEILGVSRETENYARAKGGLGGGGYWRRTDPPWVVHARICLCFTILSRTIGMTASAENTPSR